jgi:uncharacterized protein (DUF4415 family)
MSEKRIVRYSPKDREEGRTDWERLRTMTVEEIERGAESDPDNPPWTEEELAAAELLMPSEAAKVPLSIRLDQEVVEYFKEQGPGYQSRMNAVLLGYVRSKRRRERRRSGHARS